MKEMKYDQAILNDFFHVKQVHILNEDDNDGTIWKYMRQYVGCKSRANKCTIYMRNDTDRDKSGTMRARINLYKGLYESQQIAILQWIDSIHSYLIHHDVKKYAKTHSKIDHDMEMDVELDIDEKSESKQVDRLQLENPKEINPRIANKYVTKVVDENEFKSLNFGLFFTYSDTTNERYIKSKYNTLKEELLNNTIYAVSNYQWMDVYLRCDKLKKTQYCKKEWTANDNGLLNESCGVPAGSEIQIDQLISLFFCINFSNLSKLFISNGCRQIMNEPLENLCKRHSEISIWSRRLRQSVWYFGNFCKSTEVFYHGFNKKILFGNCHVTIEMPLFVTKDLNLLSANHDGIIFKLSADTGSNNIGYPYFNTSFITDFNHNFNDCETLFFHCNLQLNDIFYQYQSYSVYLQSLFLFQKITKGYYFNDMLNDIKYQNNIIDMINGHWFMNKQQNKNNMKNNDDDNNNKIPSYIQQLFEYYTDNKSTNIWLIPSEFNKLCEPLKQLFFGTQQNQYGRFLNTWKNSNNKRLTIKFVHEFKWEIYGDILLQFHSLQLEQAMMGPVFVCNIDIKTMLNEQENNKRKDTDDSDESNDTIMEEQKKEEQEDEDDDLKVDDKNNNNNNNNMINMDDCIVFIPYCRKSTKRENDYGEFGLYLQKLPSNIASILFEYEVYCPQASYSLCVPPQKWMSVGENVAFTSFKTQKVQNLPFVYNVALKIKEIKCC